MANGLGRRILNWLKAPAAAGAVETPPAAPAPIDAVITWVDGFDPAYVARREACMAALRSRDPIAASRGEGAFTARRYGDHEEIRYCVRSIANHAPWVRTIWIVTDDQIPPYFDLARADGRIRLVSHTDIFNGMPAAVPNFSSTAIESVLWRIDGLAEHYLYFNDDFFLARAAAPSDFFQGDKFLIRGRWTDLSSPDTPPWLLHRVNAAELFGYGPEHVFVESHGPAPQTRSAAAEMWKLNPAQWERNVGYRFRGPEGFAAVTAFNHWSIRRKTAIERPGKECTVYTPYPRNKPEAEVRAELERIVAGKVLSVCFNALDDWSVMFPDVYDYLDRITGPRLEWERPGRG